MKYLARILDGGELYVRPDRTLTPNEDDAQRFDSYWDAVAAARFAWAKSGGVWDDSATPPAPRRTDGLYAIITGVPVLT